MTATETADRPGLWIATRDGSEVGRVVVMTRPDGRRFVYPHDAAHAAFLHAIPGELYAEEAFPGFAEHRRDQLYAIPTDQPARSVPDGYAVRSADDIDADRLRILDDALRHDVPGTDGWRNDPVEFIAQTYEHPQYDPETYVVAVDIGTGDLAGLVRVWNDPRWPRLGLVAILPAHRRRGLSLTMLARVCGVLAARGHREMHAEVDMTNTASHALLAVLRARRAGVAIEYRRPAGPIPGAGTPSS